MQEISCWHSTDWLVLPVTIGCQAAKSAEAFGLKLPTWQLTCFVGLAHLTTCKSCLWSRDFMQARTELAEDAASGTFVPQSPLMLHARDDRPMYAVSGCLCMRFRTLSSTLVQAPAHAPIKHLSRMQRVGRARARMKRDAVYLPFICAEHACLLSQCSLAAKNELTVGRAQARRSSIRRTCDSRRLPAAANKVNCTNWLWVLHLHKH